MKKTLIALMALAGVAMGADGDLTSIYTFETLKSTMLGQGSISIDSDTYTTPVYDCTAAPYYKYNSSTLTTNLTDVLTGATANTSLTIAAWVDWGTSAHQTLFSWGENGTGIKFCLDGTSIRCVTKDVSANWKSEDIYNTGATNHDWSLVAVTLKNAGDNTLDIVLRDVSGDRVWTFSGKSYNAPNSPNAISLLTANVSGGEEQFNGYLAGLQVFTSTGSASSVSNAKILAAMGSAPTVPEPTTATLSLLALAGLAARRRRK